MSVVPLPERVPAQDYRTLMGCFPTGVTVITSLDETDSPHGLTCNSLASVSIDPPTLLICLGDRSGTLSAIHGNGRFGVNLLNAGARRTAELFASPQDRRFDHVEWRPSPVSRVPWLVEDAFALIECRVSDMTKVSDHTVVFGVVDSIESREEEPLVYGMRRFWSWSTIASESLTRT